MYRVWEPSKTQNFKVDSSDDSSDDSSQHTDSSSSELDTKVGLKVVYGPDKKLEKEDGGEGHVGTVVDDGLLCMIQNKWVPVVWDNGCSGYYKIGKDNLYDLRTLDNSSIGVHHPNINCNSCCKKGIIGMRWSCKICTKYNLCTRCYMSDKHDITHTFIRIETPGGYQVDVPKRQDSVKILMRGIFASSKVVRGRDWNRKKQDGGGKTGVVINVRGWNENTDWNACLVFWPHNHSVHKYRIGYEGKVDLECTEDAPDGYYYRDHLPITGDEMRAVREETSENAQIKEVYDKRSIGVASITKNVSNTVKEFESSTGVALLSQNWKDLFFSGQFSDLTLKVQQRIFQVHKAVLYARAAAFASKVLVGPTLSWRSSNTNYIGDCDPNTFEDVLFYLYTGKLKRLSLANVNALLDAANKFEIQALKEECVRFKEEGLSIDYVSDFLAVA